MNPAAHITLTYGDDREDVRYIDQGFMLIPGKRERIEKRIPLADHKFILLEAHLFDWDK